MSSSSLRLNGLRKQNCILFFTLCILASVGLVTSGMLTKTQYFAEVAADNWFSTSGIYFGTGIVLAILAPLGLAVCLQENTNNLIIFGVMLSSLGPVQLFMALFVVMGFNIKRSQNTDLHTLETCVMGVTVGIVLAISGVIELIMAIPIFYLRQSIWSSRTQGRVLSKA